MGGPQPSKSLFSFEVDPDIFLKIYIVLQATCQDVYLGLMAGSWKNDATVLVRLLPLISSKLKPIDLWHPLSCSKTCQLNLAQTGNSECANGFIKALITTG